MSEEKRMILNMLKEGKIDEDEAIKLLDAIGKDRDLEDDLEESAKNFANKIFIGVNKALRKTGDALSSIDVSDLNIDLGQYKSKTEKIYKSDTIAEASNILIENLSGRIHVYSWDNDYIETRAAITYNSKYFDDNNEFIVAENKDDYYYIGIKDTKKAERFNVNFSIAVPRVKFEDFIIKNTSGSIEVNFIESDRLTIENINGAVECNSSSAEFASFETTQGSLQLNDIKGERISLNTTNGAIQASDLSIRDVFARTVNGSVKFKDFNKELSTIDLQTVNGSIGIDIGDFSRPIRAEIKGRRRNDSDDLLGKFKNINKKGNTTIAETENYKTESDNKLEIKVSTVNGRINIK